MAIQAGAVGKGRGEMGLAHAGGADKDNIGLIFNKVKSEDILDLKAIDLLGPGPVELIEGFDGREACEAYAAKG